MCAQSYLTLCNSTDYSPQVPLSMGLSRQEYCCSLPFPTLGDLSDPEIEPAFPVSPALTGRFFTTESPGTLPNIKDVLLNSDTLKFVIH